jgi:formate dehydrogenase major subunit
MPASKEENGGLLCVKGKYAYGFLDNSQRLNTPLIRKNGELVEASWDEAIDLITDKILQYKEDYGPDVFTGLASARCSNEDNYLFQKLFRAYIGTNNIDHCARL